MVVGTLLARELFSQWMIEHECIHLYRAETTIREAVLLFSQANHTHIDRKM